MDFRDLYQDLILEHAKRPRNFRTLDDGARHADGFNPLCGDRITVHVLVDGGVVRDVAFQGSGCAISQASASVMTEALKGRTVVEAEALFERFRELVTAGKVDEEGLEAMGKLAAFQGVSDYPTRVKCAILAWHALHSALAGDGEAVTTE